MLVRIRHNYTMAQISADYNGELLLFMQQEESVPGDYEYNTCAKPSVGIGMERVGNNRCYHDKC